MPKTKDKQTVKKTARTSASPKELAFEIRDSRVAGKGAFATRPIKKGERLIEYTGERIPHPVADERYDDALTWARVVGIDQEADDDALEIAHGDAIPLDGPSGRR